MAINQLTKKILFIAILIFFINLIFRIITLTNSGIWYDEAFSIYYSQFNLELIKNVSEWDISPPFYYYVLHFWIKFFGISENAVRILSIIFTCFASSLLFIFAYRYFNFKTALLTSILFFASNEIYYYSQEARTYSLLVLFAIASSYCFFELMNKPKWPLLFALGIINWAAINSHYFFLLIPAFQFSIAILSWNKKLILYLILSIAFTTLLFNYWLNRIYFVFMSGSVSHEVVQLHVSDFFNLLISLTNGTLMFYSMFSLAAFGIYYFIKNKSNRADSFNFIKMTYIFSWAFVPILFIYFLSNGRGGIFIPRYLLFTIPSICLVLSILISQLPLNKLTTFFLLVSVFIVGLFSINYKVVKGYDYKSAVPFIVSHKNSNTLIIVQTTALLPLFTYYYDRNIFKDLKTIQLKLAECNIILKNDSTDFKHETIGYKSVILVQTFQEFEDTGSSIISYVKKRYKNSIQFDQFSNALVTFFRYPIQDTLINFQDRISNLKLPLQNKTESRIKYFRNAIMNNPEWLNTIRLQAEKQKISLDSAIENNIIYMINQEK